MKQKEYILCSAVWFNDHKQYKQQPTNIKEGFVITGRRHSDCYQTLTSITGDCDTFLKLNGITSDDCRKGAGFITNLNRFVDRKEGWSIAIENDQVIYGKEASDNGEDSILISENLY